MGECSATDGKVDRIFLWMNPRSLSTVFTKCVSFMEGACIWVSPYGSAQYGDLISNPETVELYPKLARLRTQVLGVSDNCNYQHFTGGNLKQWTTFSYDWAQEELSKPLPAGKKFIFVREAAKAICGRFHMLPKVPFKHTFIIRDPHRLAVSNRKLFMGFFGFDGDLEDFDMYDSNPLLDTKLLPPNPCHDVWKYVKANIDPKPVVIDADDLQNYPEQILKKYCDAVDVPFKEKYLEWDQSEESVRYFNACIEEMALGKKSSYHDAALSSSHFKPVKSAKPKFEDLTQDEQRYVLENQDGYNEMYASRIKPDCKN